MLHHESSGKRCCRRLCALERAARWQRPAGSLRVAAAWLRRGVATRASGWKQPRDDGWQFAGSCLLPQQSDGAAAATASEPCVALGLTRWAHSRRFTRRSEQLEQLSLPPSSNDVGPAAAADVTCQRAVSGLTNWARHAQPGSHGTTLVARSSAGRCSPAPRIVGQGSRWRQRQRGAPCGEQRRRARLADCAKRRQPLQHAPGRLGGVTLQGSRGGASGATAWRAWHLQGALVGSEPPARRDRMAPLRHQGGRGRAGGRRAMRGG